MDIYAGLGAFIVPESLREAEGEYLQLWGGLKYGALPHFMSCG